MYIHEATKEAEKQSKFIYLNDPTRLSEDGQPMFKIKPTDTSDCCIFYQGDEKISSRWNPQQKDLLSKDWELCN